MPEKIDKQTKKNEPVFGFSTNKLDHASESDHWNVKKDNRSYSHNKREVRLKSQNWLFSVLMLFTMERVCNNCST